MKKFIIVFAIMLGVFTMSDNLQAQRINININVQPTWGPVGYNYVDYYYLPDTNVYYIVNSRCYVYLEGRRWITARYLPYSYRNYDLYRMYKVVLTGQDRNDPWRNNNQHYREYSKYKNRRGQSVIRDSRDDKYRESRNNRSPWYNEQTPRRESNTGTSTRPQRSNSSENVTRPSSTDRDQNRSRTDSNRNTNSRTKSSSNSRTTRSN